MDFRTGKLVPTTKRPDLAPGTIVWSYGFAGQQDRWAVVDDPQIVKLSENSRADYFAQPFHNLDAEALPISEKFGIGFYYDLEATPATPEEVQEAIDRANEFTERTAREEAEEEAARAAAWANGTEAARKEYGAYLTELEGSGYPDAAQVAKNLRKALAHSFPGQKFSVRKEYYDCISVDWTNGPTEKQVREIAGRFELAAERDPYNDDLWDYSQTAFTALYGGVKYLHINRAIDGPEMAEIAAEIEAICPDLAGAGFYGDMFAHEGGSEVYGRYLDGLDFYNLSSWHSSTSMARCILGARDMYHAPEKPARKGAAPVSPVEAGGVEVVDYSENAIAVVGDTRPIKDTLKGLGGRFNFRLSCGAGWIFPKKKEAEVRGALGL